MMVTFPRMIGEVAFAAAVAAADSISTVDDDDDDDDDENKDAGLAIKTTPTILIYAPICWIFVNGSEGRTNE